MHCQGPARRTYRRLRIAYRRGDVSGTPKMVTAPNHQSRAVAMWKGNGQRSPCRPPSSTARKHATVAVALAEAKAKGIPGATVHVIVGEGHLASGG